MFTREFNLKVIFYSHNLDSVCPGQLKNVLEEVAEDVRKEIGTSRTTAKKFSGSHALGNSSTKIEWSFDH